MGKRSAAGHRRHIFLQQERRKTRRRARALAGLDDPVSLILDASQPGQVPITLLPLQKLKVRVEELNLLMDLASLDDSRRPANQPRTRPVVAPAQPIVAKRKHPFPLEAFHRVHRAGSFVYQFSVNRGLVSAGIGEGWALIKHADLAAALPELRLDWGRRRLRYLVQMQHDDLGAVQAIRLYSINYTPILERRFVRCAYRPATGRR
jgi:hypothetical protein